MSPTLRTRLPSIFLGLSALVWLPYGVYCFFEPGHLEQAAGVSSSTATGQIELRAMYGGLQTGIGVLALLAAFRPALLRPALVTLAFLCGGLGLSRFLAVLGVGDLSGYTAFALIFEWASAALALWLLARTSSAA